MTKNKARATSATQKGVPATNKPVDRTDLDAEIVRDLEVDQRAAEVRGGACPKSKPV